MAKETVDVTKEIISPVNKVDENSVSADSIEKLKQLKELLDAGIITQEEFDLKKQDILKKI